jgi:hypothetical protein
MARIGLLYPYLKTHLDVWGLQPLGLIQIGFEWKRMKNNLLNPFLRAVETPLEGTWKVH